MVKNLCAAVCAAMLLGGCAGFGYYLQAANGHLEVLRRAQPIATLLDDPAAAPELKQKLAEIGRMKEFAARELLLPAGGSYRKYADLQRPYALWNVFAAPEFSVQPREWCFLFAGCVSYRGYFSHAAAVDFAQELQREGYETYVSGVPAYSTLGWLDDPVLSTFARGSTAETARVIFHELAHRLIYVRDDTEFNESFAVMVETEGMRRWLEREAAPQALAEYAAAQRRKSEFAALVAAYRARLAELYASNLEETQRRADKARIFAELREAYQRLKTSWGGYAGYDKWFAHNPNNAQLASVAAYTRLVPAFAALLAQRGGDLALFYRDVAELAKLPRGERSARLESFLKQ